MTSKIVILVAFLIGTSLASSFLAPQEESPSMIKTTTFSSKKITHKDEDDSSNASFELLTLTAFLTSYNFSAEFDNLIVFANQANTENIGILNNQCSLKDPSEVDPMSLYCSLILMSIDQKKIEIVRLYLNESEQIILNAKESTITYTGVSSSFLSSLDSSNNTQLTQCQTDVTYSFVNAETSQPFDYLHDPTSVLSVSVSLSRGSCGYEINTPSMISAEYTTEDDSQILTYVGVMMTFGLIHSITCGRLIKRVERHPSVARRTSIGSLVILMTFDFYIYLIHFRAWADNSDWLAAIFITFFMVSVFFEPALLYYVFDSLKNRRDRPVLDLFYDLYFWGLIGGVFLVLSLTCVPNCLLYACPFFLLPQIMETFNSEKKYKWNWWLLLGLGLPKLLFIWYVTCVPDNMINEDTNPMICYSGAIAIVIQFFVLGVQTKLPKLGFKMKPYDSYSYSCSLEDSHSISTEVCSICTETVSEVPLIGPAKVLLDKYDTSKVMKTPCSHFYHDECLKEWIKKKLECPNCRQKIPPLEDDDH